MDDPTTVVLADDHALVRDMLRARLVTEGMDVVAGAGTTDDAVTFVTDLQPDILILDIDMPGRCPFEAAREVSRGLSGTRVLFLSAFVHDRYVQQALASEASGYLTKTEPPEVIVDAVRKVLAGAAQYSEEVVDRIVIHEAGTRLGSSRRVRLDSLTDREREVLGHVARGLLQKQIARQMNLSIKTVQAHIAHLMDKLKIHDRVELARFAIREGLVEP